MTNVLLVDDHPRVRAGLVALLSGSDDISVVGVAADGREAVRMATRLRPDVVVMDLSMPILDGVGATRLILDALPGVNIVVLTGLTRPRKLPEGLSGVAGYLAKDCDPRDLVRAVRSAGPARTPQ